MVQAKKTTTFFHFGPRHDQIFQLDPPDYNLGMSCCAAAKMWQAALSFLAFLALTRYEGIIIVTGWWFGTWFNDDLINLIGILMVI